MMITNIDNQTMTLSITMFVGSNEIIVDMLLDSGATGCYIHQAFVKSLIVFCTEVGGAQKNSKNSNQ